MSTYIHGVFLNILETGVLLLGPSGIGKSELALTLIQRGHCLIADDAIEFSRQHQYIEGRCPPLLQDFLATRSLGILNIRRLYGDAAICSHKALTLIIELTLSRPSEWLASDGLDVNQAHHRILDIPIAKVSIPIMPGFHLATLVEVAVRNHLLQQMGYNASLEFRQRQKALLT